MNQDGYNHHMSNIQSTRGAAETTHLSGFEGQQAEMPEFTSGSQPSASPLDPEQVSPNELEHSVVSSPSPFPRSGGTARGPPFAQTASVFTATMLLWFLAPPAPSSSEAGAGAGAIETPQEFPPIFLQRTPVSDMGVHMYTLTR